MSIEIKTVTVPGFEMRYFSFGTGTETMVIIPGLSLKSVMLSAEFIAEAYKMFAEKYTVYVFDRRSVLPEKYTVMDMAHDTESAMDAVGIKNVYLFGTSQGGMMSQVIAAERPDLVCKAVFASTTPEIDRASCETLKKWVDSAKSADVTGLVMTFSEMVYSNEYFEKNRKAFEEFAKMIDSDDLRRFIVLTDGTENFSAYKMLDDIKCPVLVTGSERDKIFGAEPSRRIAEKLGCELYIYEGYGHAVYDEAPDYKQRLFDFFEK